MSERRPGKVEGEPGGRDRVRRNVVIRGKLWLEVDGNRAGLTDAGADLLEQIMVTGSLSAAARNLGFAYRRAWLLVNGMNQAWETPLVTTAAGGHRGGGAKVTERGQSVLSAYRDVQLQLEHLLDVAAAGFQ